MPVQQSTARVGAEVASGVPGQVASADRPPFHLGFWAWMSERFPPSHAVLFVVLYLTASMTAQAFTASGAVSLSARDAAGCIAAYAFFLMLRIFDEHKDYAADVVNHPQRALQRGWITLGHLRVLGAFGLVVQLVVSIASDGGFGRTTAWWIAALAWSLLMAREFFAGDYLRPRLVLYAVTHMLVMPLIIIWLAEIAVRGAPLPREIAALAVLSFSSGFAFELARKTKAPEDERHGVETYSSLLGPRNAALTTIAFVLVSAAVTTWIISALAQRLAAAGPIVFLTLVTALVISQLVRFGAHPSAIGAKRSEKMVSVALLASHAAIIAAIVAQRGIQW